MTTGTAAELPTLSPEERHAYFVLMQGPTLAGVPAGASVPADARVPTAGALANESREMTR